MLIRHPNLTSVPQGAPQGLDTPLPPPPSSIEWHSFTNLIPIYPGSQSTADPDPKSSLEGTSPRPTSLEPRPDPDVSNEGQVTWHDIALNIAAEMLWKAREAIRNSLGYTTSAGLARNKFLAKVKLFFCKAYLCLWSLAVCITQETKPTGELRWTMHPAF